MMKIAVGESFPLKINTVEGNTLQLLGDFPFFISKFRYPCKEEIKNYTNGNLEFRVLSNEKKSFHLLLIKIGSMVQECVFNSNIYEDNELENYIINENNVFNIILLNSYDRVEVLRAIGLTEKIRKALCQIWTDMINNNVDQEEFLGWYWNLTRNFTTKELWNRATVIGRMRKED
ncbi:hypothetical protein [Brassicibacter mesophilus]|uniref:hypothetical protein n=1 Tax=Brassicibacter mesophilus TaxID=745119 RepID=UPI003D1EBD4B